MHEDSTEIKEKYEKTNTFYFCILPKSTSLEKYTFRRRGTFTHTSSGYAPGHVDATLLGSTKDGGL